jgi:hypothetical protein
MELGTKEAEGITDDATQLIGLLRSYLSVKTIT